MLSRHSSPLTWQGSRFGLIIFSSFPGQLHTLLLFQRLYFIPFSFVSSRTVTLLCRDESFLTAENWDLLHSRQVTLLWLYCIFFNIFTISVIRRSTKPFLSLNGYIILSTGLPRIWKRHALRPRLHDPWTRGRQWRNSTLPRGQWWEELQHRVHQPRHQREKQGE